MQPVAPRERWLTLDTLRGIALFGVLYANLHWAYCLRFAAKGAEPELTLADLFALRFMIVMVTSKAQTLLVLLFGLGFANQLLRAEARGESVLPLYVRRIVALFAIGWCHAIFLAFVDVTWGYAVAAPFLLPFIAASNRTRFVVGVVLVVIAGAVSGIPEVAERVHELIYSQPFDAYLAALAHAAHHGSRTELWIANARVSAVITLGGGAVWYIPSLVGRFLLGYVVGAQRWFERDGADQLPRWRRVFWIALGVATVSVAVQFLEAVHVIPQPYGRTLAILTTVLWQVGLVALAAVLAATVVVLARRRAWRAVMSVVAPVGRMPLTTYLCQSVICTTLFYRLDWSMPTPAQSLGLSIAIFMGQIVVAHLWLSSFQFGPAEWLWRTIVYWRPQPMRWP